ncbi:MAG: amino acid ABC transporter substrate-binding protein, partial [Pseudomonas sp.]
DLGMAVHESNRQLAYALEEVLERLIHEGRLERIYRANGLRYELPGLYQDVQ